MRALIVDDSKLIRHYTRRLLERMGLSCDEAGDAEEAMTKLAEAQAFDFMLLDVHMPGMNGLELVKKVRGRGLQPLLKVMMVTAQSDDSLRKRALQYGADEYLMKPFTAASLREKLVTLGMAA